MVRPSKASASGARDHKDTLFNGDTSLPVSLLRVLTPAGVLALIPVLLSLGGSLNQIQADIQGTCQTVYTERLSLYQEHKNDKYRGLFPKPDKPRCYK